MKKQAIYTRNQIANAASAVFNPAKGLRVLGLFNSKRDDYTWNEANGILTKAGWSPRHLLMLIENL